MRQIIQLIGLAVCLVLGGASGTATAAPLAVIAHPSNSAAGLGATDVADLYLGKTKNFPDGKPAAPVDQTSGNAVRIKFYEKIVQQDDVWLKSYWSKMIFTGNAMPPKVIGDDAAVREWVSKNPDAIGYVDGKAVDASVKVLLILP